MEEKIHVQPTPTLTLPTSVNMAAGKSKSLHSSNLKYMSLVVLILQTSALVLVLRYSRTMKMDGPRYLSSTAVVVAEFVKFLSCLFVIFAQNEYNLTATRRELRREIADKPYDTLKVAVPAVLYVIQNNLLFFALSKLDAATYQVTYQLKILTTAFFSVSLLNKRLNFLKWVALVLLMIGVAFVQMPSEGSKKAGETEDHSWSERMAGLAAVLAACCSSGFSGVYLEKILKGVGGASLWMRNLQLAFFSIFGGLLMVALYDYTKAVENGFFQGYNSVIWIVVILQAYGGLIISLVVKYADNILKGFAVSLSIILSSFISYWFLGDFEPSAMFVIGASIVIASTFLYGYEPPSNASPVTKPM